MTEVTVRVNGMTYTKEVEPRMLLVHFIREVLGVTGTNKGWDSSQDGVCAIHLDCLAVR